MKINMVWDGLFHTFTWWMTVVGLGRLWRAGMRPDVPWSTRTFVGSLSLGWGAFNVVEGLIDHQLLGIHHVHPGAGQLAWDVGFLLLGALLVAVGWALVRAGRKDTRPRGAAAPLARERPAAGRAWTPGTKPTASASWQASGHPCVESRAAPSGGVPAHWHPVVEGGSW